MLNLFCIDSYDPDHHLYTFKKPETCALALPVLLSLFLPSCCCQRWKERKTKGLCKTEYYVLSEAEFILLYLCAVFAIILKLI